MKLLFIDFSFLFYSEKDHFEKYDKDHIGFGRFFFSTFEPEFKLSDEGKMKRSAFFMIRVDTH